MDLNTLIQSAPAAALAIAGLWMFFTGKIHSDPEFRKLETENRDLRAENDRLRDSLATERRTVNETAQAGQVTNKLISALTALAAERKLADAQPGAAGLTAEDVGL